jgi:hypothetical protein
MMKTEVLEVLSQQSDLKTITDERACVAPSFKYYQSNKTKAFKEFAMRFTRGYPSYILEKHLNLATKELSALFSKHSLAPAQEQVNLLKGATRYECLQMWIMFKSCIHNKVCNGDKQTYDGFQSMMRWTKDDYLTKHMNIGYLGGPLDVKDAVETNVPFEVNKCAAAEIKAVLQNGSDETIREEVVAKQLLMVNPS